MTQALSRLSVATAGKNTGSIAARHRTFLRSMMLAGLKCVGVFMPLGQLVAGDVMLAQKIALETNESAALAVANRFLPRGELPGSWF